MCYNISYLSKRQEKYEKKFQELGLSKESAKAIGSEFTKYLKPMYLARGFEHPLVPIISFKNQGIAVDLASWGLIPEGVNDYKKAIELRSKTLNARVETLSEKPSYKKAYATGRSLLLLDYFFEFHKVGKESKPHLVSIAQEPFWVAAISIERSSDTISGKSFSLVTQAPNSFMKVLHNKSSGARQPMILTSEEAVTWLQTGKEASHYKNHAVDFSSYEVAPLTGHLSKGNLPMSHRSIEPETLF